MTRAPAVPLHVALERTLRPPGEPPVEVHDTHCSWVFLTRDRAYKLKKPARFGFVDLSSPEARRRACEAEERVNAELAPGIVLGVRGVASADGEPVLVDARAPEARDWIVEMRRFDEERTMAAAIRRGELADEDVVAVAARIAAFHAGASPYDAPDHAGEVQTAFDRNAEELASVAGEVIARRSLLALERFAAAFVFDRRAELAARGRAGLVRDGHGDLRAEHVLLEDPLRIVDRLEFDARLRRVDVADDLAFLVMDLEALGERRAARLLVDAYRGAGGDPGDDELIAFFAAYRALVRAKVALLRAAQRKPAARRADEDEAGALVALATRLSWRARGHLALLVHGPPASGKTRLATALAAATGIPVVATDAVRKELLGLAPGEPAPAGAYEPAVRRAVYAEVGRRAAAALAEGSVVVDATLGDPAARDALFDALHAEDPRIVAIECRADRETLLRRARRRTGRPGELSDAGPAEVARLAGAFTPLDELPPERRLAVDSERSAEDLVDQVADWLDEHLAGYPPGARAG